MTWSNTKHLLLGPSHLQRFWFHSFEVKKGQVAHPPFWKFSWGFSCVDWVKNYWVAVNNTSVVIVSNFCYYFLICDKGLLEVTHCFLSTSVCLKGVDLKKNLKQIVIWAECMIDNPMVQWIKNPLAMEETQETQVWSLGWEDPLEEENGNLFQYSCLKNPMDRGAWWATVHRVTEIQIQLRNYECVHDWHTLSRCYKHLQFGQGLAETAYLCPSWCELTKAEWRTSPTQLTHHARKMVPAVGSSPRGLLHMVAWDSSQHGGGWVPRVGFPPPK